jgi:hypothetical protein
MESAVMSEINRPSDPDVVAASAGRLITKRTRRPSARRRERSRRARGPPKEADDDSADADAFSIAAFCRRHAISPSFYHKLQKQGLGPRTLKLGSRTLITADAAAEWRRQRAAASV